MNDKYSQGTFGRENLLLAKQKMWKTIRYCKYCKTEFIPNRKDRVHCTIQCCRNYHEERKLLNYQKRK